MNRREFRQRIADLLARRLREGYEGPGEDPSPPAKKPPAKEAATLENAPQEGIDGMCSSQAGWLNETPKTRRSCSSLAGRPCWCDVHPAG